MRLVEHIKAERSELAELLEDMSAEELAHPSLCEGWSVRDVAAHAISYDRINPLLYVALFLVTGFSIDRANNLLVRSWRRRDPAVLVQAFRQCPRPRGMMRLLGKRVALLDVLVNQQDIRRPLDRPREISADRSETVVRILTHHRIGAGGATRARGLSFHPTDAKWSVGNGPEIHGPAEAIVMALAGRRDALRQLGGDGLELLAHRVTHRG